MGEAQGGHRREAEDAGEQGEDDPADAGSRGGRGGGGAGGVAVARDPGCSPDGGDVPVPEARGGPSVRLRLQPTASPGRPPPARTARCGGQQHPRRPRASPAPGCGELAVPSPSRSRHRTASVAGRCARTGECPPDPEREPAPVARGPAGAVRGGLLERGRTTGRGRRPRPGRRRATDHPAVGGRGGPGYARRSPGTGVARSDSLVGEVEARAPLHHRGPLAAWVTQQRPDASPTACGSRGGTASPVPPTPRPPRRRR
ncbi:hypothetical protein SHIRM173S_03061 [Streptomyces hirsutus]